MSQEKSQPFKVGDRVRCACDVKYHEKKFPKAILATVTKVNTIPHVGRHEYVYLIENDKGEQGEAYDYEVEAPVLPGRANTLSMRVNGTHQREFFFEAVYHFNAGDLIEHIQDSVSNGQPINRTGYYQLEYRPGTEGWCFVELQPMPKVGLDSYTTDELKNEVKRRGRLGYAQSLLPEAEKDFTRAKEKLDAVKLLISSNGTADVDLNKTV